MIGIAQQNLDAKPLQLVLRHALDRARCAHGHEDRRFDHAMRRVEPPRPRAGVWVSCRYFKSQISSPVTAGLNGSGACFQPTWANCRLLGRRNDVATMVSAQ